MSRPPFEPDAADDPFDAAVRELIEWATNRQIFERDGGKCVRCGGHATSTHHRIHGDRSNRHPSNLLSACGTGTTGCHGWFEANWRAAADKGWTVSRHGQDTTKVPAWYENGPLGRGEYLLDDYLGYNLAEAS